MERKPIFEAVRRLLGRGFSPREVAVLDAAIDAALGIGSNLPTPELTIGPAGIALIQRWEGCARKRSDGRFETYPDPGSGGDPWTIGWGTTGHDVVPGLIWSQTECDERLVCDLQRFAHEVTRALDAAPTTQHQFDALVSFHYNTGAIARATLTRLHVAGRHSEAAEEFARWVHAGGNRLSGLVRRRATEAALYRS